MKKEDSKASRASQSRVKTERKKHWTQPSYLDTPNAPNGFRHRWVRFEILGYSDAKNVQGRLREGYELVRGDEFPELDYPVIDRREIQRGDRARRPCLDKSTKRDRDRTFSTLCWFSKRTGSSFRTRSTEGSR